jgi:hypothetical protein
MTAAVERIVDDVQRLERHELDELLAWLADYELAEMDEWDREIERDSRPGGPLQKLLDRARQDAAEGRTRPLDEVLDNP